MFIIKLELMGFILTQEMTARKIQNTNILLFYFQSFQAITLYAGKAKYFWLIHKLFF